MTIFNKKNLVLTSLILLLLALVLGGFWLRGYLKENYFAGFKNDNGRVNILLLGINDNSGTEKDLTDTIIFASLNQDKRKVSLLSIPRDLWINEIKAKINATYHYGGADLIKKTVGEILGQPVHYFAVMNFDSFEKIIDYLGGIEVNIEREFDDYKYPIPGKENDLCDGDKTYECRFEHLHFTAGKQLMDGKTALKFVRSRNAVGEEGTDFARSARQQKVLLAIKEKISDKNYYRQPKKMLGLLQLLEKEITTDIKPDIYGNLAVLGYRSVKEGITLEATAINGNLLVNPRYHYSRQWVLIPKSGQWEEVREFVRKLLE